MCEPSTIAAVAFAAFGAYASTQQASSARDASRRLAAQNDPAIAARAAAEAANAKIADKRRRRLASVLDPASNDPLGGLSGTSGNASPFLARGGSTVLGGTEGYGATGATGYGGVRGGR